MRSPWIHVRYRGYEIVLTLGKVEYATGGHEWKLYFEPELGGLEAWTAAARLAERVGNLGGHRWDNLADAKGSVAFALSSSQIKGAIWDGKWHRGMRW